MALIADRPSPTQLSSPVGTEPVHRAYWLEAALGCNGPLLVERLQENITVDVCIVGGGYTGLWTALELRRRDPDISVAILEADLCGSGASGRNGGFVQSWWSKFDSLRRLCGEADALRLAREADASIDAIEEFCRDQGIGSAFSRGGWLWAATNEAQVGAWQATIEALAENGERPYVSVGREAIAKFIRSECHLEGVYEGNCGLVQPAVLARRLTDVARETGILVYEQTPVTSVAHGSPNVVATSTGTVRAERVVLAINAWAVQVEQIRKALVVVSSDIVATEPIRDKLAELGWDPKLAICDSRRLINYYRVSGDNRLIFGKGGGTIARGARVPRAFNGRSPREHELRQHIDRLFPSIADVAITHSWRGPIDYSSSGLPFFHQVNGRPDVITVVGYSGNGVGPAHLSARMLASKVLDLNDESVPAPLNSAPVRKFPPEPLRYVGAQLVRAATARKEQAEDRGRKPGGISRLLASLDPTSVVDRGESE